MYYNIKIKSNGSEFSLESSNKEITQREMDMYFACIFNVSDEFKSHIKKVEIKSSNVKSINEIESYTNNKVSNNNQIKQEENIKLQPQKNMHLDFESKPTVPTQMQYKTVDFEQPKPIQTKQTEQYLNSRENIAEQEKTVQPYQTQEIKQIQNQNLINSSSISNDEIPEVKFENNSQPQFNNEQSLGYNDLSIKDFDLKLEEMPYEDITADNINYNKYQNENLSIKPNSTKQLNHIEQPDFEPLVKENLPTRKLEEHDTKSDENIIEIKQNPIRDDKSELSEIDELISLAQNKINSFDINTNSTNNSSKFENIDNQINEDYDTINFDIDSDVTYTKREIPLNDKISENSSLNKNDLNDFLADDNQKQHFSQTSIMDTIIHQQPINEPQHIEINTQQQIQEIPQGSYQHDFKLYLSEFNYENTAEIFLICAFYIKNILQQENFTMKFINSKLFQATGRIADLRVLDDLISKEYIRVIESLEFKKYSITPDGEGYFIRRFQG